MFDTIDDRPLIWRTGLRTLRHRTGRRTLRHRTGRRTLQPYVCHDHDND
jgi:hypothetical protein